MKKIVFSLIFLIMISFAGALTFEEYYKIDLNYNKGDFNLLSLDIEFSDTVIENNFGFYSAEVLSFENQTLNLTSFYVSNEILYDEVDENGTIVGGGLLELNDFNFTIYVPYYENANEIIIYNENRTEKLRIDVSMYSKEVSDEGIIGEGKSGETEKEKSTKTEEESFTEKLVKNWWVLVIVLIILLIIAFIKFRRRN